MPPPPGGGGLESIQARDRRGAVEHRVALLVKTDPNAVLAETNTGKDPPPQLVVGYESVHSSWPVWSTVMPLMVNPSTTCALGSSSSLCSV